MNFVASETRASPTVQNALLSAFPDDVTAALKPHLRTVAFRRGDSISVASEATDDLVFLESGVVSAIWSGKGPLLETHLIGAEGCLGSGSWMFPVQAPFQYAAHTSGSALRIDARKFREIAASSIDVQVVMSEYSAALTGRIAENAVWAACQPGVKRLAKWFLDLQDRTGEDQFEFTQATIGESLGLRRTTVNEVASKLANAGAVFYTRGKVTIKDRAALEREAYR